MKRFLALALVASLSACAAEAPRSAGEVAAPAPVPTPTPASAPIIERADTALTRAESAYALIRGKVDGILPLLPASWAAKVVAARDAADAAFAAARAAVTMAEQAAALRDLEQKTRALLTAAAR